MINMSNMLKCKNVVKSNKKVQVYDIANASVNSGRYVKIGTASHNQYNSEVAMLNYTKDTKCQKYTINNIALYIPTDETLVKSTFEVIGEEPIFGHCISTQDLINIYTNDCIQEFYEEYCKLHTDEENLILGKVLSILGIEIWRNVTCYDGIFKDRYMVSNLGRVKSLHKNHVGKIVKQYDNGRGYLIVQLWHNYQEKCITVHRLVALTFYGEPTEKMDACHSNANKLDNRLVNLKFGTRSYNMQNPITRKKYNDTIDNRTKADKAKAESSAPTSTLE